MSGFTENMTDSPPPADEETTRAQDAAVQALLGRLSSDWQLHDTASASRADNIALHLMCGAGLVEERLRGRAWGEQKALDFEATVRGVWLDDRRNSILPEELRRCVPAWKNQEVTVELQPRADARLTTFGLQQKRQWERRFDEESAFFRSLWETNWTLYLRAHPIRGRAVVRLLGNEGPAPGRVSEDGGQGATVETLQDIATAIREQNSIAANAKAQSPEPEPESSGRGIRHEDRGIQVEKQLQRYLADRKGRYNKLVPRVKEGDTKAFREFRELFGPTAFARHIADGDEAEVGRNKNAVQSTQTYQLQIKPLFQKPPRLPHGWRDEQDDPEVDELYSEFLGRLRES